ncbi:MAG: ABC transporter permease [Salinivirgaceae bacterium]|nr:ABC transporter permease [Salinivirgaceae bacterium]
MLKRALQQTGYILLILWGVVTLLFFLFNVLPGDPARMLTGQRTDKTTVENIKRDLGLDLPQWQQYLLFLNDLSPLSFDRRHEQARYEGITILPINNSRIVAKMPYLRKSYQTKQPVTEMIATVASASLLLAFSSILLAIFIGIPLGVFAASKAETWIDRTIISVSSIGMSLPSFFAAILIGWLFAFVLGKYTGLSLTGSMYNYDIDSKKLALQNLILPSITLGIRPLSVVVQLTRNSLLTEIKSDYFRTARAKGLSIKNAIWKHALRNSLNPVVTALSGWFASMLAGMVFVEYIFSWKGLGYMLVDALNQYDFPVVIGCILFISVLFIAINILTDLIYKMLDPQMRLKTI